MKKTVIAAIISQMVMGCSIQSSKQAQPAVEHVSNQNRELAQVYNPDKGIMEYIYCSKEDCPKTTTKVIATDKEVIAQTVEVSKIDTAIETAPTNIVDLKSELQEPVPLPLRLDPEFEIVRRTIPFASNSIGLGPNGRQILSELLPVAREAKSISVRGRTDAVGQKDKNKDIAVGRALEVRRLLITGGIPANMIRTSYCTTCFVADNNSDNGRRLNRRVDVDLELQGSRASELDRNLYKPLLTMTPELGQEIVLAMRF